MNINHITWELYFGGGGGGSAGQDSLLCYCHFQLATRVLLRDQYSIRWTTPGTLSSREEQVSLQHVLSITRGLNTSLSHPSVHSTTIKLYLSTHLEWEKQLSYPHKGVNKRKSTLTEAHFHDSNAKATLSLQILLKAYSKLGKTTHLW